MVTYHTVGGSEWLCTDYTIGILAHLTLEIEKIIGKLNYWCYNLVCFAF